MEVINLSRESINDIEKKHTIKELGVTYRFVSGPKHCRLLMVDEFLFISDKSNDYFLCKNGKLVDLEIGRKCSRNKLAYSILIARVSAVIGNAN